MLPLSLLVLILGIQPHKIMETQGFGVVQAVGDKPWKTDLVMFIPRCLIGQQQSAKRTLREQVIFERFDESAIIAEDLFQGTKDFHQE